MCVRVIVVDEMLMRCAGESMGGLAMPGLAVGSGSFLVGIETGPKSDRSLLQLTVADATTAAAIVLIEKLDTAIASRSGCIWASHGVERGCLPSKPRR